MAENSFDSTVASLFKGMENFISAKTVIGEAITVNDTTIVPLIDVGFYVGAGAGGEKKSSGGGMSGKMSPSAVLVIKDGVPKLVNIKNQDTITKLLDMVPGFVDRFSNKENEEEGEPSNE